MAGSVWVRCGVFGVLGEEADELEAVEVCDAAAAFSGGLDGEALFGRCRVDEDCGALSYQHSRPSNM
ncbi:hypothetical protein GCM10022254_61520 [Actinomadura meridiana]|uniref:Uncharacterized protein n=1 Tax=Actinomadura meridiana TaxID=559626 RepID=A0ABP8CII7_9ACTN